MAVVSDEEAPYKRAALVKLLKNPKGKLEVFRDKLEQAGIRYFRGKAVEVDPSGEALLELNGEKRRVGFRKLVVATGGKPGLLSISGLNLKGVFTFRFRRDALALAWYVRPGMKAYVVGGGLIGLEVAEALLKRGVKVHIVKRVPGVLVGILERDLSLMAAEMFERRGISV
ncbi:MAG: pyridine nucleotide-disulfide oxidoreductase, partial [Candidatus Hecatellales archaeon B24]